MPSVDAAKFYGGLLRSYYHRRWSLWYDSVGAAMRSGRAFNQSAWGSNDGPCQALEAAWVVNDTQNFATEASGDVVELAKALYAEYVAPMRPLPAAPPAPSNVNGFVCDDCGGPNPPPPPPVACQIRSGNTTVELNADGRIMSITVGENRRFGRRRRRKMSRSRTRRGG